MNTSNTTFKLKTVNEKDVFKILKKLKAKKSYGQDVITAEIPKLGAGVLKFIYSEKATKFCEIFT